MKGSFGAILPVRPSPEQRRITADFVEKIAPKIFEKHSFLAQLDGASLIQHAYLS
jgi:hypothetical protein